MINKSNGAVEFIGHGGCLTSRTSGGYKGFPERFTIEEMTELLDNPQFPGKPVNKAYANLVEVRDGEIIVKKPELMRDMLNKLSTPDESTISRLIEHAGYADGRRSKDALLNRIIELEKKLKNTPADSSNYKKTRAAIETFQEAIKAGGEAAYYKRALLLRRRDIQGLISSALYKDVAK
jgi:hypothetical protein